jgi:two-component system phosphate regulon response regulator OmpR
VTDVPHLVVVDDEAGVRSMVRRYLERQGFRVSEADGGPALRDLLAVHGADLVLLDVNMPGEDGLSVARELRRTHPSVGVVMLTANSEPVDKVVGLEIGADDYVAKPADLRELLARVRAVLRRRAPPDDTPMTAPTADDEIRIGICRLDIRRRRLLDAAGSEVPLTAMEYDLLRVFAANPGRVLSRENLLWLAHNKKLEPFDRSIDTRITRLRQKIEADPERPEAIKTVRAQGYVYVPQG